MSSIYVFDLDGTLMDSMSYFAAGLLKILDDADIPYEEDIVQLKELSDIYVKSYEELLY